MTEHALADIDSTEGMRQRLAREVSWALHSGGTSGEFEVLHSEWKPETGDVLVHDFAFSEDGQDWKGSFRITIDRIDAYVDEVDDDNYWDDDEDYEGDDDWEDEE